ncbi:MAG TPA: PAS domain S-box protein [Ktedonobacteraceae bacterium]|nr:PAS domain S-box protein [Ktedonobacteraceae bacterium]
MHEENSATFKTVKSSKAANIGSKQYSHLLLDISERLHATLESAVLLDQLIQEAIGLSNAQAGYAGINTPQGMVTRSYFLDTQRIPFENCWPQNYGLASWLVENRTPYLTNFASVDPQTMALVYPSQNIRSILSVPLLGQEEEVLGFFEVHNKRDERGFTAIDQEKLLDVARIASSALRNALLFEQQLQRAHYQLRLDDTSSKPVKSLNLTDEQRFQTLIEHSSDAIALLDEHGVFRYISSSVQRFLGFQPAELVGQNSTEFVPPDQLELVIENFESVLRLPRGPRTIEHQFRHKDGRPRWIESTITNCLDDPGIGAIVCNFRDITAHKQIEGVLEGEKEILERIIRGESLGNILMLLARLIEVQSAGGALTSILLLENGVRLRNGASPSLPQTYLLGIDGMKIGPSAATCGTVAYRNEPVYVSDIASDPLWGEYRELALSHGLRACWSIPIRSSKGDVLGTFAMYYHEPHIPDSLEQQLIELIIHTAALAIEHRKEEEERYKLAAVVAFSDDAIVSKTLDGLITNWNAAAERLFGYSAEEAIGQPITMIIPPELHYVEKEIIEKLKQGIRIEHFETVRVRKDGSKVAVSISISPVKDRTGKVIGASKIARDVTSRRELEERKNEFISMASHELKTPVTSIKGFTQVLQRRFKQRGDQDALKFMLHMDSQLNRLTLLINDLLDLSKIEKGQLVYRKELFDLGDLTKEIAGDIQETTQTHKILLETQTGVQVFGDRDRIGQVLINFMTNAIKYSFQADSVVVRLQTVGDEAVVSVQDFGVGIPEAEYQKIFERFYQAPGPGGKMYPGLGIGLYISQQIIERHHGRIWVSSQQDEGSTFFFALSLKPHE